MKTAIVELCQRNSIGTRYCEPRVIEWREVSEEEAERLVRAETANGRYWRRQPEDMTGAMPPAAARGHDRGHAPQGAIVSDLPDTLGARIRRLRLAAGLSQEQLARASGLPQSSISTAETGSREPMASTLFALARGLGVSLAAFDDVIGE